MNNRQRTLLCLVALVVRACVLVSPARAEDSGAVLERGYRTRAVLQRHCLKCHGDDAKGAVRLLDRTLLVDGRQLVRPGSPDTSELLDLVRGGSMPPGNHPKVGSKEQTILEEWIRTGAPALPSDRQDAYVLWTIAHDWPTLEDKQRPFVRYLSLNHLLATRKTVGDLDKQRQALEEILRHLVADGKPAPKLQTIESTGSVFRIDLRDLGWDKRPYEKETWLNLFDLLLLEYPYGRLPNGSPFYPALLTFLRAAQQVRPVPYVRADWLVHEVSRSPLYADFLKVLGKPPDSKPPTNARPQPLQLDKADLAERGGETPATTLLPRGVRHTRADDAKERRILWPRPVDLLDDDSENGIPIVPLDGLTCGEHNTDPLLVVEFKAIAFDKRGQANPSAQDRFAAGERLVLRFKANKALDTKVVIEDKGASAVRGEMTASPVIAFKADEVRLMPKTGYAPKPNQFITFTVYAYPTVALKASQASFPEGTLLQAPDIHDRVVHRHLYDLSPEGRIKPPDPSKMVKVSLRIKILPPANKND